MFFTSVGFSIDMHFCQGHLQSISFLGSAEDCYGSTSNNQQKSCLVSKKENPKKTECALDKKDCCHNKNRVFQASLTASNPSGQLVGDWNNLYDYIIILILLPYDSYLPNQYIVKNFSYPPPLLYRNIPILIQSFLL